MSKKNIINEEEIGIIRNAILRDVQSLTIRTVRQLQAEDQARISYIIDSFERETKRITENLKLSVDSLLTNKDFTDALYNNISRYIKQEIQYRLSKEGYDDVVRAHIKQYVKSNFAQVTRQVVTSAMNKIEDVLLQQINRSREIMMVMDTDIRQFTQQHNTSTHTDELLRKYLMKTILSTEPKLKINILEDESE